MTDLRAPEDTTLKVHGLPSPASRWSVQCLNCAAPLNGPFCSQCGQRAVPPHPTVRELAGDAFAEFSGWDGKFSGTIRTLLRKPGELTRQWIEGRRISFVSPLRVYLTASLVYFVVAAAAPNIRPHQDGGVDLGAVKFGVTKGTNAPQRVSNDVGTAVSANRPLTGPERDSAIADIAQAPPLFRPMLLKAVDDPANFKNAVQRAMPNVFLGLVPVLGLILALFYRGRHYPDHLYFAIHLAAFIFIARTVGNLALFTHSIPIAAVAQVLIMCWIVAYGVMALRRVYGGSVLGTILKGIAVAMLYSLVATPVILVVALIAAST
jgi:hypothetical protein